MIGVLIGLLAFLLAGSGIFLTCVRFSSVRDRRLPGSGFRRPVRWGFVPIRSSRPRRAWAAFIVAAIAVAACGRGGITSTKSEPAYAGPLDAGIVRTSIGLMRGMVAADYRLFQGIPYAAPPVGPLRWQLPRPAARWAGMLDASKPGPQCMQDTGRNPRVGVPTSENCLTLNVWTPASGPHGDKRPVMVWIHGGGFVNGNSAI